MKKKNRWGFRSKMTVAGIGGALFVVVVTYAVSASIFRTNLAEIRTEQAAAIRDGAVESIRGFAVGLERKLHELAFDSRVKIAFSDLNDGFAKIDNETSADGLEIRKALEAWHADGNPETGEGTTTVALPDDANGRIAQLFFIFRNPYPFGEKNRLSSPKSAFFSYAGAHETHHRLLDESMTSLGKCDLLFVNTSGTVVYSRFKNPDFGTNLVSGLFKESGAAGVFRKAFNTESKATSVANFGAYGPIRNRSAAFAGLSLEANGEKIGVIVIMIPKNEVEERTATFRNNTTFVRIAGGAPENADVTEGDFYISDPAGVKWFDRIWTVSAGIERSRNRPILRRFRVGFVVASVFSVVVFAIVFSFCVNRFAVSPFMNVFMKVRELSKSKGDLTQKIPVESKDEIGLLAIYLNDFVETLKTQMEKVKKTSGVLNISVRDLTASSANIRTTSNRQAAAVKEVVTTMEDSDRQSKVAASKIREVAGIADQTRTHAEEGATITGTNRNKMHEIRTNSGKFIDSLKSLGEQIKNIGEIIGMINSIADQTKIIAFNAELEASAAGEAGKNFEIVADEIRRLANNTMTSTKEIKERIRVIQSASESLIGMSEAGMRVIDEGWKLSSRLEQVFGQILESAETSAESAHTISTSFNRQAVASEEILRTLKQLSIGIENLVEATKTTANASETMMSMSEELNSVVGEYVV